MKCILIFRFAGAKRYNISNKALDKCLVHHTGVELIRQSPLQEHCRSMQKMTFKIQNHQIMQRIKELKSMASVIQIHIGSMTETKVDEPVSWWLLW